MKTLIEMGIRIGECKAENQCLETENEKLETQNEKFDALNEKLETQNEQVQMCTIDAIECYNAIKA